MDPIEEVLTRGVENIIPSREVLEKVLRSDKKLNIYLGIDPTFPKIHLGHAVPLRKLKQLVELGHNITFLIGDFTAFIGDTSDKNLERPALTEEEISLNWQTYKNQAEKILDFSKVKVVRNSEWLDKVNFKNVIKLARQFSLNDFISRELIAKRLAEGKSVNLAEVLYPLAQGYDSFQLKTDLQIGGTEQIFNIQAGRTLIKNLEGRESYILTLSTLEGTDGRKMSKSWNNGIWLDDNQNQIFGKVMSLKDDLIIQYFILATEVSTETIQEYKNRLKSGENPLNIKKILAKQIVSELCGTEPSEEAQEEFEKVVQKQEAPSEIEEFEVEEGFTLDDVLAKSGAVSSKSEAKRLIEQKAVDIDDETITDANFKDFKPGTIIKAGKRRFLKIK